MKPGQIAPTRMATRSAPMKRAEIKRSAAPLARSTPLARVKLPPAGTAASTLVRTSRLRSRGPKMTPIKRAARGEECDLNIDGVCTFDTATTVWCHSNLYADGKGMGIKANDEAGCYGCVNCHAFYDGGWVNHPGMTRDLVEEIFAAARARSRLKLKQKGLVA